MDDVLLAKKRAQIHEDIEANTYEVSNNNFRRWIQSISGGKRQRLALARALIGKPIYLVARRGDCALDTVTERKIDDAIQQLNYTKL
jgi:ABC-type multidrug transport system fused ATPase/permease subunit